jgi:quercetin dioxygenase-like cupin family protein
MTEPEPGRRAAQSKAAPTAEVEGAHAEAQRAFFGQGQDAERLTFYDVMDGEVPVVEFPGVDHQKIMKVPDAVRASVDLNEWYKGRFRARPILNHSGENPKSILQVSYARNAYIPQHYHDVDQMVFVVKGSLFQGKREFKAGAGYYTPAGVRYSVKAGPEGVSVIEIRRCSLGDFDTVWVEENPDRWV